MLSLDNIKLKNIIKQVTVGDLWVIFQCMHAEASSSRILLQTTTPSYDSCIPYQSNELCPRNYKYGYCCDIEADKNRNFPYTLSCRRCASTVSVINGEESIACKNAPYTIFACCSRAPNANGKIPPVVDDKLDGTPGKCWKGWIFNDPSRLAIGAFLAVCVYGHATGWLLLWVIPFINSQAEYIMNVSSSVVHACLYMHWLDLAVLRVRIDIGMWYVYVIRVWYAMHVFLIWNWMKWSLLVVSQNCAVHKRSFLNGIRTIPERKLIWSQSVEALVSQVVWVWIIAKEWNICGICLLCIACLHFDIHLGALL